MNYLRGDVCKIKVTEELYDIVDKFIKQFENNPESPRIVENRRFRELVLELPELTKNIGYPSINESGEKYEKYLKYLEKYLNHLIDEYYEGLEDEKKAINKLREIADVTKLEFESRQGNSEVQNSQDGKIFKRKFEKELKDDRGWDALILIGHGKDSGLFWLSSHVSLNLKEFSTELKDAQKKGLRLVILNSCEGATSAKDLIELGIHQVVCMGERIPYSQAMAFFTTLCQSLTEFKDIHESFIDGKNNLIDKSKFPSLHLVPRLFRHPAHKVELFKFEEYWLRRFIRQIKPNRFEAIASGVILALSLIMGIQQGLFLNLRLFGQSFYRDIPRLLGQKENLSSPQITVITVEGDMRDELIKQGWSSEEYLPYNVYSDLINKLTQLEPEQRPAVIGIAPIINQPFKEEDDGKPFELAFAESVKNAVEEKNTWFVFAKHESILNPSIVNSNPVLQGDYIRNSINKWFFIPPYNNSCSPPPGESSLNNELPCSFPYQLALAYHLNQLCENNDLSNDSVETPCPQKILQENINNQENLATKFQDEVGFYLDEKVIEPYVNNQELKTNDIPKELIGLSNLLKRQDKKHLLMNNRYWDRSLGISSLVDYSLPPNQVYQRISAKYFLENPDEFNKDQFKNQIVIIGLGQYWREDNSYISKPWAYDYWCWTNQINIENPLPDGTNPKCSQSKYEYITPAEVYAYKLHHLINEYELRMFSVFLTVIIGIILSIITFLLLKNIELKHRQTALNIVLLVAFLFMLISYQLFITLAFLIPFSLAETIFFIYLLRKLSIKQGSYLK